MEYFLYKEGDKSKMEEIMSSTTTQYPGNQSSPTFPPWKLYHNPFYCNHSPHEKQPMPTFNYNPDHHCNYTLSNHTYISSALSSSTDLTFSMESAMMLMKTELEEARAQIIELKAELEFERRLRKKMECHTKRMAKELEEERRGREAAERVCEELGNRVSGHKAEIDRIRREMNEERRMLRVAEVFREERVQMKLADAKIFYEAKLLRLEQSDQQESKTREEEKPIDIGEENEAMQGEKLSCSCNEAIGAGGSGGGSTGGGFVSPISVQRRASPEPENPHIKRGIKGSVEFQRVVRALCSNKSNRHLGGTYKLECQKAQLKILLKQRSPIRPNSLIMS